MVGNRILFTSCLSYSLLCDCAKQIEGAFWFSVVWSLGANLDGPSRAVFNTFLRRLMSGKLQDEGIVWSSVWQMRDAKAIIAPPNNIAAYVNRHACFTSRQCTFLE